MAGIEETDQSEVCQGLKNQQTFQDSLDYIFDVAHRDAMALIRIEEDRLFLEAQREKGRRGTMGGIDRSLALKEERVMKRKIAVENYAKKSNLQQQHHYLQELMFWITMTA